MRGAIKWSTDRKHLLLRGSGFGIVINMKDIEEPMIEALVYRDGDMVNVGLDFVNNVISSDLHDMVGKAIRSASKGGR